MASRPMFALYQKRPRPSKRSLFRFFVARPALCYIQGHNHVGLLVCVGSRSVPDKKFHTEISGSNLGSAFTLEEESDARFLGGRRADFTVRSSGEGAGFLQTRRGGRPLAGIRERLEPC